MRPYWSVSCGSQVTSLEPVSSASRSVAAAAQSHLPPPGRLQLRPSSAASIPFSRRTMLPIDSVSPSMTSTLPASSADRTGDADAMAIRNDPSSLRQRRGDSVVMAMTPHPESTIRNPGDARSPARRRAGCRDLAAGDAAGARASRPYIQPRSQAAGSPELRRFPPDADQCRILGARMAARSPRSSPASPRADGMLRER